MNSNTQIDQLAVEEAMQELIENAHLYKDVVDALAERKRNPHNPMALLKLLSVGNRAIQVAQNVAPVAQQAYSAVKEGTETSEFKMANSVNRVLMIVTFLAPAIDAAVAQLQHTSFGASVWVVCASLIAKALVAAAYTSSRTQVKKAQAVVH